MKAIVQNWLAGLAWRLRIPIERLADDRLKSHLRFCGSNVSIRQPTVIECPEHVSIQDDVSIASFVHIWGNGGIEIGARTMIGSHAAITSATHDPDSPTMYSTLLTAAVAIGSDVWIGAHSIIFPGVTIGEHAVIAAGAIVRESVEPYTIVAGIPARVVRTKIKRNT